jgi:hypothetical protein
MPIHIQEIWETPAGEVGKILLGSGKELRFPESVKPALPERGKPDLTSRRPGFRRDYVLKLRTEPAAVLPAMVFDTIFQQ